MKNFFAVILFVLVAFPAWGEDSYWKDRQGHPVPSTEARQSERGFGGWVLVTSDADWEAKWNTPAETVPEFKEAKSIPRGKHIFVLTFFANPQLSNESAADIICDINIVKPDGSAAMNQTNAICYKGSVKGNAYSMYLSLPVIDFVGDPDDPLGKWTVRISLKDNIRKVTLPLQTSFELR
jgi:hypothetical protein